MRWATVFVVALVVAGCGGSSQRRASVDTYFRAVNRLELRAEPSLRAANAAFRRLRTESPTAEQNRRLRAAVNALATTGAALRQLAPPPEAAQIHRDLLRLYVLQAKLVREVQTLVRFLPAAQQALKKGLAGAGKRVPTAQLGRYADRLRSAATELAALKPPPALKPWTDEQITQFRRLAREVEGAAAALRAHDSAAARVFVVRYRRLIANGAGISSAHRRAVLGYNARVTSIARLREKIAAEHAQLNQSLR